MGNRRRGVGLVGPAILIGLGGLFLLDNLGLLAWSVWDVLFRLWPVLLIAFGLDMLIGRRSIWGSLLVLIIVAGVVAVAMWGFAPPPTIGEPLASERISQALDGATRADVQIAPGVGVLRIAAMPEAEGLIEGSVVPGPGQMVVRDFSVREETAYFRLRGESTGAAPFGAGWGGERVWDLNLSPGVPMRLQISTGVGESTVDLTGLQITDLDVNTGVGRTVLTLPAYGQFQARVEGGVGEVTVIVPQGMSARIWVNAGLGDVQVVGPYQSQGDNVYASPGHDAAENRVDLRVNGGIGKVEVREAR